MGGPKDGKYYILPAVNPKIPLGADSVGNPWVPVVTDGKYNVFIVKNLENGLYNFSLILGGIEFPLFIKDEAGNLVASEIKPPNDWVVRGTDCGPYAVELPSCFPLSYGWTVRDREPKSEVTISTIENPVQPKQQWNFVPWSVQE